MATPNIYADQIEWFCRNFPGRERIVVITPSEPLPVGRWTMEWARISRAIDLGRRDMAATITKSAQR